MIICDRCKKVPAKGKHEPFLYELVGSKMEETKVGKRGAAVGREIVKIPMHLCDTCITAFNRELGAFIVGIRDNEPVEFENDTSRPVGLTERDFGRGVEGVGVDPKAVERMNRDRGTDDPNLLANKDFVSPVK
jgi:hypothetical protein